MKDRKDEKVVIAFLTPGTVHTDFMQSVLHMVVWDATAGHNRILDGGGVFEERAGANLSDPRNNVVRKFLANTKADWLLMVDSDMVFAPDALERLVQEADPEKAPIVGGLCISIDHDNQFPTLYDITGDEENPQFVRYNDYPDDTMFQVAGTGTGFLLMHRSALEAVRDYVVPGKDIPGFNQVYPWFQETEFNGKRVGEDLTFCIRAGWAGLPVYVNTGVHIGHIKFRVLNHDSFRAQVKSNAA